MFNRRTMVAFAHPFLLRRGDWWGFCSADLLQVGDWHIGQDQREEGISSIDRMDAADPHRGNPRSRHQQIPR